MDLCFPQWMQPHKIYVKTYYMPRMNKCYAERAE